MRTTDHAKYRRRPLFWTARVAAPVAAISLALVALFAMAGCSAGGQGTSPNAGSSNASAPPGAHMAGPAVKVVVTRAAIENKPQPWVLTTPQAAVRSYLDWVSYADRIATSDVATPTMGAQEAVRVDSYIQYNIEKLRVIDQTFTSITFGTPTITATRAILPAKESWTYRYVSIKAPGGKTLAGPYTASYDTTYTVVKSGKGSTWVVDSVKAQALGKVK